MPTSGQLSLPGDSGEKVLGTSSSAAEQRHRPLACQEIPPQRMEHLTAKPAELAVRAMQYSSRAGENVLDLFGGSGSTLIAAQQSGGKAFLMELDGLYCDVIVDRFQRFSGVPAILGRDGRITNSNEAP